MFPPGRRNDSLDAGETYLISLFGTNEMLTAVGEESCLREYQEDHWDQMWICKMTSDYRIGMRNRHTGNFLGCSMGVWLIFMRLSQGGYSLKVNPGNNISTRRPLQYVGGINPHLKVGEVCTQFGLHKLKNSVLRQFECVIPGCLVRSSTPYHDGEDSDQSINETSIEFLKNHEIKNIISLNSIELSPQERGRPCAAKISYSHIMAVECTAVMQGQFDQIWDAYDKAGVTIVYCGYGDGRTGMAISAIQLFQGQALDDNDYRGNGVQYSSQLAVLNELSKRIHG
ncbi:hypothetical protein HOY80DRAFT_1102237 [Tuber brumale]|nr:hypothetical protein HOY80DRAFT_1102237 [Tuber brumale]